MKPIHATFSAEIPANYDRLLVPLAFDPAARDLARKLAPASGALRVLETACGTGSATREVRERLAPGSTLHATDLGADMVRMATERCRDLDDTVFSLADAHALPFDDQSFDLVFAQFGLALFADRDMAMAEMVRVLVPGGHLVLSVWDGFDVNPAVGVVNRTIKSFFATDPPGFLDQPFGTIDRQIGEDLFSRAGLTGFRAETTAFETLAHDYQGAGRGFVTGNPILLELRERGLDPERVVAATLAALEAEFGPPPVALPFQATVFFGEKPH